MNTPKANENVDRTLRVVSLVVLLLGTGAAFAGLLWSPADLPATPGLHGQGLYWRDTAFVAGGSQGSDLLSLILILPLGVWAIAASRDSLQRLGLVVVHTWWLYLSASLAFGAIAFNELFPLYVVLMPASAVALLLALNGLGVSKVPRGMPVFLVGCGILTGLSWAILLWLEMTSGAFPPATYYTVRTTYTIDLGIIAPACIAAGLALANGWRWGTGLALPLVAFAALLLPMMVLQTVMQIRVGVAFGPEAAVPFIGFTLVSVGATWFLIQTARYLRRIRP